MSGSQFLNQPSTSRFLQDFEVRFSKGVTFYERHVNKLSWFQCSSFPAIIAFKCIGQDIGILLVFCHYRFLRHRQDIGFITFRPFWFFSKDKIFKRILVFSKIKKKLTDIGLFDGSSQTLD